VPWASQQSHFPACVEGRRAERRLMPQGRSDPLARPGALPEPCALCNTSGATGSQLQHLLG